MQVVLAFFFIKFIHATKEKKCTNIYSFRKIKTELVWHVQIRYIRMCQISIYDFQVQDLA